MLYKNRMVRSSRIALRVHPNKPEAVILNMLDIVAPNQWAFVGDGRLIISGKNPDFANLNGKKQIIECFGQYWHGKRARCYEETEEGRIALFKEYGYDTLVIWDNELRNPEQVMAKIKSFSYGY